MKFLIIGLGNIGSEYDGTRHNIGFDVVDVLAIKHDVSFKSDRLADITNIKFRGRQLVVIKPTTFMNLSGKAVKYWMDKEKVPIERVLVIVDEIALPLKSLRMKTSGSDGGHNGLKSIQESLNTSKYPRLRFGIGNDYPRGRQVDFVLGKWTKPEIDIIKDEIPRAVEMIETFCFRGIQQAMNQFNS